MWILWIVKFSPVYIKIYHFAVFIEFIVSENAF